MHDFSLAPLISPGPHAGKIQHDAVQQAKAALDAVELVEKAEDPVISLLKALLDGQYVATPALLAALRASAMMRRPSHAVVLPDHAHPPIHPHASMCAPAFLQV